jgi:acetyltransferase-like isoleucine patch superfamily enzyme
MEALKEIGIEKALKFTVGMFQTSLLRFPLLLPQMRVFLLRLFGAVVGRDTIIHNVEFINVYRRGFKGLKIGDHCFIGNQVLFDLADEIILDNHVTLSERSMILTHTNVGYKDHPLQSRFPSFTKPVKIKSGCFIGINTTILPGVTVGKHSFIGACSLINKNVPDEVKVAGIPFHTIGSGMTDEI